MSTLFIYASGSSITLNGQVQIDIIREAAQLTGVANTYPNIVDQNRVIQVYIVRDVVLTVSDWETLLTKMNTAKTSYDSGYPKLRVYNKSSNPYYNEFQVWFDPAGVKNIQILGAADGSGAGKVYIPELRFIRVGAT